MKPKELYKDGTEFFRATNADWIKRGTRLNKIGLIVAPEDYINYESGKQYFNFYESLILRRAGEIPGAWHVPSIREWTKIDRYFKPTTPKALDEMVEALHLGYTGRVLESKKLEYDLSPEEFSDYDEYGKRGYYWSTNLFHGLKDTHAQSYRIIKDLWGVPEYQWRFFALRVRCVMKISELSRYT